MKKRQVMSLVLVGIMAASLTACGGGTAANNKETKAEAGQTESGKTESSKTEASSKTEDRVKLRWLTTGDAAAKAIKPDDRIIAAINEKLGIDLTVEIVPEANTEKVNVAMASGDFPDVVTGGYGTSATQQWIDDGMVIPLNDYFDTMPNIKKWLDDDYQWSAIDGKYYGLPFITQYNAANALIIFRQDWLDKLGLKYPETLDDICLLYTTPSPRDS